MVWLFLTYVLCNFNATSSSFWRKGRRRVVIHFGEKLQTSAIVWTQHKAYKSSLLLRRSRKCDAKKTDLKNRISHENPPWVTSNPTARMLLSEWRKCRTSQGSARLCGTPGLSRSGRWTYQLAPNLSARTWERPKPASPSTQARERKPSKVKRVEESTHVASMGEKRLMGGIATYGTHAARIIYLRSNMLHVNTKLDKSRIQLVQRPSHACCTFPRSQTSHLKRGWDASAAEPARPASRDVARLTVQHI